jgi:hypothetical protein
MQVGYLDFECCCLDACTVRIENQIKEKQELLLHQWKHLNNCPDSWAPTLEVLLYDYGLFCPCGVALLACNQLLCYKHVQHKHGTVFPSICCC